MEDREPANVKSSGIFVIETPEPNLSRAMRRLDQVYTQAYNRWRGGGAHRLQRRFKSIVVDKVPYLLALSRYIALHRAEAHPIAAWLLPREAKRPQTNGIPPIHSWFLEASGFERRVSKDPIDSDCHESC